MNADLTPYRHFRGQAREAFEAYAKIFGAEVQIMTFGQMPGMPAEMADNVMHAELRKDGKKLLFASDVSDEYPIDGNGGTPLSLTGDMSTEEEIRGYWDALAEGATITQQLEAAPWGAVFGALIDRFGTHWMFNIGG